MMGKHLKYFFLRLMTKEQIEMLRSLIKGEIEAALQNESGYRFAFEQE